MVVVACCVTGAVQQPLSPTCLPASLLLQRELRQLQLRMAALQGEGAEQQQQQQQQRDGSGEEVAAPPAPSAHDPPRPPALDLANLAFPMRPIGILRSCFTRRNGTPRQPLLVPAARARLALRPELGAEFLEGLQQYSHCWVLYIFHENTDLQRLWQPEQQRGAGVRSKIRVPRLDGAKLGVFATRSPHRCVRGVGNRAPAPLPFPPLSSLPHAATATAVAAGHAPSA